MSDFTPGQTADFEWGMVCEAERRLEHALEVGDRPVALGREDIFADHKEESRQLVMRRTKKTERYCLGLFDLATLYAGSRVDLENKKNLR